MKQIFSFAIVILFSYAAGWIAAKAGFHERKRSK